MRGAAARNILKAWVLVAILAGIFGGIGWLLADERGAALFAFASLLAAAGAYAAADRTLLGMLGARQFALAEDPLLRSTVDRLSARIGIAPPRLQLLDDGFPRAFVVGRNPRSSTLAVSTGLLTALTPGELEAVLAHELAHVRTRDVLTQTQVVLLATTLLELSRVGGFLSRFLVAVLAPVGAAFTHLLLSQRRELTADAACDATLLHGDLHDENVLAATREPWLAIDPQPRAGHPGFELHAVLRNRRDELGTGAALRWSVRRRTEVLCDAAGIDAETARRWTIVRCAMECVWALDDDDADTLSFNIALAKALDD